MLNFILKVLQIDVLFHNATVDFYRSTSHRLLTQANWQLFQDLAVSMSAETWGFHAVSYKIDHW